MKDNKNLYFIPILAKAFDNEDQSSAFKSALKEIIKLGKMPEYQKGFEQFEMFIASGVKSLKGDAEFLTKYQDLILNRLLIVLVLDTFEGSEETKRLLIQRIQSNPEMAQRYEKIRQHLAKEKELEPALEVELFSGEELTESQPLPTKTKRTYFTKIKPGAYTVRLSNGLVLWEGVVEAKDINWKIAFPNIDYPLAATTEIDNRSQTKSVSLLDGEIELRFHAGLETGSISLILKEIKF